mgnify:CR=1 FL=1
MKRLVKTMLLLAALTPVSGYAQDEGLYDPLPPEGSAFVRFFSESTDPASQQAKANGKGYDYLHPKEISSYYIVPQGKIAAVIGKTANDFDAEAGKFYTVVLNNKEQLEVKTDPANDNQAKAQIIFYNLSEIANLS